MENEWKNLGKQQEVFAFALARLITVAWNDYKIRVRIKDVYRDPRLHGEWGVKKGYGAAFSVHKLSLAADLYTEEKNYPLLHDLWDSYGGAERIKDDMNHFSFEFDGKR